MPAQVPVLPVTTLTWKKGLSRQNEGEDAKTRPGWASGQTLHLKTSVFTQARGQKATRGGGHRPRAAGSHQRPQRPGKTVICTRVRRPAHACVRTVASAAGQ